MDKCFLLHQCTGIKILPFHLQMGVVLTWFSQWNVNGNVTVLLPAFSERTTGIKWSVYWCGELLYLPRSESLPLDRWLNAQSPWTTSMNKEINYCFWVTTKGAFVSMYSEGGLFLCTGTAPHVFPFSSSFPELSSSYLYSFFKKGQDWWLILALSLSN